MRICFVSNGFGEDRSAALVAARLAATHPAVRVAGAALLSDGRDYRDRGVPVLVDGWMPRSGGFSTLSVQTFLGDLPVVPHVARFRARLAACRHDVDAVVVVGDVFLLLLARAALPIAPVFVATAKSNYHLPHSRLECAIMRRAARVVITRDEVTRAALDECRIRARFFGNLLMDGFTPAPRTGVNPSVVLLPGSRAEAAANLVRMLDVASRVETSATWICALASSVPLARCAEAAGPAGWRLDARRLIRGARAVEMVEGAFERVMAGADVALGLAGTANEQAAGLGCPVVSFPGEGPQAGSKRLRQQAALLGDAAVFVEDGPGAVAAALDRLLADPVERARRGEAGRARMGPPGAEAVARFLVEEFRLSAWSAAS